MYSKKNINLILDKYASFAIIKEVNPTALLCFTNDGSFFILD